MPDRYRMRRPDPIEQLRAGHDPLGKERYILMLEAEVRRLDAESAENAETAAQWQQQALEAGAELVPLRQDYEAAKRVVVNTQAALDAANVQLGVFHDAFGPDAASALSRAGETDA